MCGPTRAPRRRVLRYGAALAASSLVGAGCMIGRPTEVPLPVIEVPAPGDAPIAKRVLLVFLPGARDTPGDIVRQGFADTLHRRGLAVDVVVPDLHVAYYTAGQFDTRLVADIIEPARARGYRQVWLAGISLGGFGALMTARLRPEHVQGLVVLAPFIASPDVIDEVRRAGGIAHWEEPVHPRDFQRALVRWLKGYAEPGVARPPLYLGYGRDDDFARSLELLAAVLPHERVRVAPGAHDWVAWRQLWAEFAHQVPWPRAEAPR